MTVKQSQVDLFEDVNQINYRSETHFATNSSTVAEN